MLGADETPGLADKNDSKPERLIETKTMVGDLYKAIQRLRKNQRDVLILREYFELPYKEIGILLKITESSAKVLYHRAIQALRGEMV